MSMRHFTTSRFNDTLVVSAKQAIGSLDSTDVRHEADCLMEQLHTLNLKKLVFDLGKADYFGSQMIELMIIAWRYLSPVHGTLSLCQVSEAGRGVLRVVGLDAFWPVCDTLDEALAVSDACWESPD
jgi:anti-anti-sigma factor